MRKLILIWSVTFALAPLAARAEMADTIQPPQALATPDITANPAPALQILQGEVQGLQAQIQGLQSELQVDDSDNLAQLDNLPAG